MLSSTSTGRGSSDQTNYNTTSKNSTNTPKRVASSSTNSSWSSSSPSPFSQQTFSLQTPQRTMEEVWKDINLASLSETTPNRRPSLLQHINLPQGTHDPNFRNLQDFLARPFSHNEPPVSLVSTPTEQATLNSPASPPLPPPAPPPAYTNELELEVAHLMEENTRLKRQQEQLCFAAASQQPKKHNLHRSSTAPF
ncbi:protein FD isoform X2 [Prunus yedoensis var. nudiflora]|uniref:Protein FD isoform X2 n=1 Tax=Prunus yedoensis var. nudiflora TaxID=2094558 RepID=A0A314U8A9_PRUYE|nr:protein FD isoform X2 [Prunus yedoensis var. nudiflora]